MLLVNYGQEKKGPINSNDASLFSFPDSQTASKLKHNDNDTDKTEVSEMTNICRNAVLVKQHDSIMIPRPAHTPQIYTEHTSSTGSPGLFTRPAIFTLLNAEYTTAIHGIP
jgi:hypothetical protein